VSETSSPDRKRSAQKKIVKMLVHLRREGRGDRATRTELMMLAMSWGAERKAAERWAAAPGSAGTWPWDALALASGVGSGLDQLERFVADVGREVERTAASRPPPPDQKPRRRDVALSLRQLKGVKPSATKKASSRRKKPRPQPAPSVVVRRSELPRLRGAQKPPRKLDLTPEEPNPNRPAGWTTTDWINSKS
jgi:hypothetical protein